MTEKEFKKSTPEYFILRLYGAKRKERQVSKEKWSIAKYIATRARTAFSECPNGFFDTPYDEAPEKMTAEDWQVFNEVMDKRFPLELAEA